MVSLLKVLFIIIIITIPVVFFNILLANDIANKFPAYSSDVTLEPDIVYVEYINDFPAFTEFYVNIKKRTFTNQSLTVYMMGDRALSDFESGDDIIGIFFTAQLLSDQANVWMNVSIDPETSVYLVLQLDTGFEDSMDLEIEMNFRYENFWFREGVMLFVYGGIYIILIYSLNTKFQEIQIKRAVMDYEKKKEKEEEEFLDKMFGPLE